MKNTYFILLSFLVLYSCSKQEFTDANDQFQRADSLFTKANNGLKTLDSITKKISDSNGIAKKVLLPEIEKQSQKIDSTLRSGNWRIDSINKEIEKITKNVKVGSDVAKTLDSANEALKKGENAIAVLSKTADKIWKRTKDSQATESKENPPGKQSHPEIVHQPLFKSGNLEIKVADIAAAKELLAQKVNRTEARIINQRYERNNDEENEIFRIDVPVSNFDNLMQTLNSLGDVQMRKMETTGTDNKSAQDAQITLTLIQNADLLAEKTIEHNGEKSNFQKESASAFMKGFQVIKTSFLFLLPLWPFFLTGGLVLYFVKRKKKKSADEIPSEMKFNKKNVTAPESDQPEEEEQSEPDYSKYLPKK